MGIVLVKEKVSDNDVKIASEEYGEYIKIVIDIEKKKMAIGGQWHADAEKVLIRDGSLQKNIWGGGIRLKNKSIETVALINLRPKDKNPSQEILDSQTREKFFRIVKNKFKL